MRHASAKLKSPLRRAFLFVFGAFAAAVGPRQSAVYLVFTNAECVNVFGPPAVRVSSIIDTEGLRNRSRLLIERIYFSFGVTR